MSHNWCSECRAEDGQHVGGCPEGSGYSSATDSPCDCQACVDVRRSFQ